LIAEELCDDPGQQGRGLLVYGSNARKKAARYAALEAGHTPIGGIMIKRGTNPDAPPNLAGIRHAVWHYRVQNRRSAKSQEGMQ